MVSYNEAIESRRKQVEQIRKWLRDKNVRQWRRCLYLLYAFGEPMHTQDIANNLQTSHGTIYKVLKKMAISSSILEVRKKNKGRTELTWEINDRGTNEVRRAQRNKIIPTFNR